MLYMFLGACGDSMVCRKLSFIYPGLTSKQCKAKAEHVLRQMWSSPRRFDTHTGGEYVVQALYESQRGDLAHTLRPYMWDASGMWYVMCYVTVMELTTTMDHM